MHTFRDNISAARQRLSSMFNSLIADSEVTAESEAAADRDGQVLSRPKLVMLTVIFFVMATV
jgi:hypothetical protein